MSLGYAEKLSYHEDLGGQLGAPELFDTEEELQTKIDQLANFVSAFCFLALLDCAGCK